MDGIFWTTIISFYGHHYHCIVDLPEKFGMISKDKNESAYSYYNDSHIFMIKFEENHISTEIERTMKA